MSFGNELEQAIRFMPWPELEAKTQYYMALKQGSAVESILADMYSREVERRIANWEVCEV